MRTSRSGIVAAACLAALAIGGCTGKIASQSPGGTPPPGDTTPPGNDPNAAPPPPPPYEAVAPRNYVAKVKTLLTGLPATQAEVDAVTADPKAIGPLIDGWLRQPEAQPKMLAFLQKAFQQSQITLADFIDQVGNSSGIRGSGTAPAMLTTNFQESFARTAWQMVQAGQPFNQTVTTQTYQLTPALMSFLAMLDARPANDSLQTKDRYDDGAFQFTIANDATPVPITTTVNPASPSFMHWSVDKPFPNCTATTRKFPATVVSGRSNDNQVSLRLFHLLMGYVDDDNAPPTTGTCRSYSVTPIFAATDFTTWKTVSIRAPNTGEAPTAFWDLPKLRNATELVLLVPRVGFFSTPAYFANWPTNSSNQARVTTNQTLIVALGKSFDGSGSTVPVSENGLNQQHASDPACYACHLTLDPMRIFFRQAYTLTYHEQKDPTLTSQQGNFAFDGVSTQGNTIFDYANILATHPRFATAWTQKLCWWADSAACSEDDPEFLRVADAFQKSAFDFRVLVRELLGSPLTTAAANTKTFGDRGVVVSISRFDHLCASLANRLGVTNPCTVSQSTRVLSANLPVDAYGRGSEVPVITSDTSLFFRSITENLCRLAADQVVDAGTTSRYVSTKPTEAIADFVKTVMGLADADARAAAATQILSEHHAAAAATSGVTPRDALKSTFTLACTSPSAVAIGL